MSEKTIFKRIIDKEIPAKVIYEDERCLAFHDVNPQGPVHFLVIPKKEIPSANEIAEEDGPLIGHIFVVIAKIAKELGIDESGYRVVNNCGKDAFQTVRHLHFHIIGGRSLTWPPG